MRKGGILAASFCALVLCYCARDGGICVPNCSSKACGPDACGGFCGWCGAGFSCQAGECVSHGEIQWVATAGGASAWVAEDFAVEGLRDGSCLVGGCFGGTITFGAGETNETTLTASGGVFDTDAFCAKYHPDGSLAWATKIGGIRPGGVSAISTFSDESAVLTGQLQFNDGPYDGHIVKLTPGGMIEWVRTAVVGEDFSGIRVSSISTAADRFVGLTGSFARSVVFGEGEPNEVRFVPGSSAEIFVAQYDANGYLRWAKSAGGPVAAYPNDDIGWEISMLPDGSSLVAGFVTDDAAFGKGEPGEMTLPKGGNFIARYDPEGSLQWVKRVCDCYYISIPASGDGSVFVTGSFSGTVVLGSGEPNETTLSSPSSDDSCSFLARFNADGTLAWARLPGAATDDAKSSVRSTRISLDGVGAILMAGFFSGDVKFGSGEMNETTLSSTQDPWDIYVARFESDGHFSWARSIEDPRIGPGSWLDEIFAQQDGSSFLAGRGAAGMLVVHLGP